MQEVFHKFKLDLETKPAALDVQEMINAKGNSEDMTHEIEILTTNMGQLVHEIKGQNGQ